MQAIFPRSVLRGKTRVIRGHTFVYGEGGELVVNGEVFTTNAKGKLQYVREV
jgi:hypothetical protein